jgi:glutamate/tyrosine decarboxylase-like PLP-dependent enzyme
MERADSIAFDLHKWGYLPFEVGCILVRDAWAHRRAFSMDVGYLKHGTRGTAGGPVWFSDYGVQLTRGFRALKVWMALKTYGVRKLSRLVQQNVEQASYLAELVQKSDDLELMAPVALNVVCFRFKKPGFDDAQLNSLNEELLVRLQESGTAVLSGTELQGRYAMRCAITNHRSIRNDFDILVSEIERQGNLLQEKQSDC